jgi:transposase InsO family protein
MNIHSGARTCPASRALLVRRVREEGWKAAEAAEAAGVSERVVYKWLKRYREEGLEGLRDRSSRPHRSPNRTCPQRSELVVSLRRSRMTGRQIAKRLKMAQRTVSRLLKSAGLGRLKMLEPPEPPNRYERKRPGEMLHVDIKKLGRFRRPGHRVTGDRHRQKSTAGEGWEYVHVCIDDASRLAYVEVLPNEKGATCAAFFRRAVAWYQARGIRVERVMSDNGSGYRSHAFRDVRLEHGIKHCWTRPYRPRTNGKAERFIQTMLREWAYERPYRTSQERRKRLPGWLRHYNERRAHGSLGGKPPISRLAQAG